MKTKIDGEWYDIPEMWLIGYTREPISKGMSPRLAYHQAMHYWAEQTKLMRETAIIVEREYTKEHIPGVPQSHTNA